VKKRTRTVVRAALTALMVCIGLAGTAPGNLDPRKERKEK